jgi:adenine-specific DNA-methyltransferase
MWMDSLARFQELMRELFQHDLSDLDFGIYRLLRLKRDEVEAFINEQLPTMRGSTPTQNMLGV